MAQNAQLKSFQTLEAFENTRYKFKVAYPNLKSNIYATLNIGKMLKIWK